MAGRLDKVRDLKLEVSDENRRPNTGHRRICSKTYARGSDMFPRLDFAVERRASEPGLAGRLGGGRAIEQVTEWLRGTIRDWRRGRASRPRRNAVRHAARAHRSAAGSASRRLLKNPTHVLRELFGVDIGGGMMEHPLKGL